MVKSLKAEIDERGYVIVEDLLSADTLTSIIKEYDALLDRLARQLQAQGKLSSSFADLPFVERLTAVLNDSDDDVYGHLDIALPNGDFPAAAPIHLGRAVFDLLTNAQLLDKVEDVLGGEILANPIQHVRIKPPQAKVERMKSGLLRATGWHQDQGVAREVADETEMLTVWIAVTDATVENGCLQVVPFSHRAGLTTHCPWRQMVIPEQLLGGEPLPVPIKAGDAIFMHRLTQHSSLPNVSNSARWSFDLRYQPIGSPTGRDEFPSLIVRSRRDPAQVQSYQHWRDAWLAARDHLGGQIGREPSHRWNADAEVCA